MRLNRNQSPSSQRRSREREPTNIVDKTHRERDADATTMLITNEISIASPSVVPTSAPFTSSAADSTNDYLTDDLRLSGNEELGYQSFVSDELEGQLSTSTMERRHHHHRSNSGQAMDRLNTKIACTRESIRKEQTARDENVNEYLKLAANADADKQQLHRIKAVFEKKNQKSAHTISQLQKKLESYSKRVKDMQIQQNQRQLGHRQPREVLRDVGQGLKCVPIKSISHAILIAIMKYCKKNSFFFYFFRQKCWRQYSRWNYWTRWICDVKTTGICSSDQK